MRYVISFIITIPASVLPGKHIIQVTGQSSGKTGSHNFFVNTDWYEFCYDATCSRANPYENVLSPTTVPKLTLAWHSTVGLFSSSPTVVNGVVYVGSEDDNVYALDAQTGAKLWRYQTGQPIDSPVVANGVVYFGSRDGSMYALDAQTGAKLWSYYTGQAIFSLPAVANGMVYVGTVYGNLYAFHLPGTTP